MAGLAKDLTIRYVLTKLAEAPTLARSYTVADGRKLRYRRTYYRIETYLSDFLAGNVETRLIILPGLRGVGKTTLLFQIYDRLLAGMGIDQDRVLYLSADELTTFFDGRITNVITAFIEDIHRTSLVNLDKELFLLIDEAHFDKEWGLAAKVIYDKTKKVFMLITGSSALSLEMTVDVARRSKREIMFPLNFSEYLMLKYRIFPPRGLAESLCDLIISPLGNIEQGTRVANELQRRLITLERPLETEWEDFLSFGGFPFGLRMSQIDTHERLISMVDRIIEKDIFTLQSFSTETRTSIARIIAFLALQKPGGTSDAKLAERLHISPTLVRNILTVLEKTHLILSVKPYASAGKLVRKPWKYYFLSPSLNAALRFKVGMYDLRDWEMLSVLAENLVASSLFRLRETLGMPAGLFYDPAKEGVDFLLLTGTGDIVPVEVSIGKKGESQIKQAIVRYHAPHGVIISDTETITLEDSVVRIPLRTFAFA